MPNSLTYIWGWVFQWASNLSDINFPSSLIEIWEWAFQWTAITSADISNITEIKDWVFAATDKLQTITFSNNLTKIGKNAFQGSSAEMNITSNSIESIGEWAFASSNLKSIDLSKLKTISTWAFAWSKLENVEFNENLSFIWQQAFRGALSGDVELKNINCIEQQAFEWSRIGELRISWTNWSKIEMMAFKDAYIWDVYISWINKIWQEAFEYVQMRNLEIIWDWETKIELMAFSKAQIKKIHIDNVEDIGQQAFETKDWVDEVIITWSQEWAIIHSMAFKNMNTWNLNLVNINNIEQQAFESNNIWWGVSIKWTWENSKISQNAFMNSSIWHIYVNDISSIWEQSFLNIKNVEEVVVMWKNTQTAIANNAFSNLAYSWGVSVKWNLELYNVTTIWEQSFWNMSNVKSVKVEWWSSPTYISNRAFTSILFTGDNWKLELNNVNNIGDQWFYNSKNIKTVTITWDQNNGLTIAERAFQGAELISLDLTNAKDLKHQAFFNVSGLELVNIDWYNGWAIIWEQVFESSPRTAIEGKEVVFNIWDKVTYIGKWAFQDSKATSINIEWATWNDSCNTDSTKNCGTVVEERALQWTTSLQNVTFGTWVTKIWDHQFVNSKVETVVIEWSEEYGTTIGKNAFQATQRQSDGLWTVKSITLWEWVTSLGEYAFMNTRITEITIPSTVNVIPEYSFVWVKTLTGVVISEWVKVIWKWAFIGTSLEHVYIGGSEEGTKIQENAFLNLWTLTSLDIKWGVSYIGQQAFQWTSITTINIDGSKNWCTIDNWAFRNADSVTSIHLWTWVTVIEKQAFEALDSVTSITIDWAQEWTKIWEQAFHHAAQLQTVNLWSVARIDSQAFAVAWNLTTVKITWPEAPSEGTVIWDQAFLWNALTSLNLWNIKEIGNAAFAKTTNKDAYTVISDTLALMWNNAFSYTNNVNVVIEADISSLTEAQIAELKAKKVYVIQGYRINFMNEWNLYYSALFAKWSDYILPYSPYKTWYELEWWTENWVDSLFHFDGNKINSNKTFNAKWKSIEEKVAETNKEESVVFLKHTNVTIYWAAENVNIEDSTNTLQLKSNNDVKQSSIFVDTGWNSTINQELDVDINKTVEYQGWVDVYFEVKKDNKTEIVNETAKFSVPIAVKLPVSNANTEYVKVKVKHEGDETYGYKWLTLNSENYCEMWEAVEDRYYWEGVKVVYSNGERYATIYTCSASTFIAYTESTELTIPQPSRWVWRPIKQETKVIEEEHDSAAIEEITVKEKSNNPKVSESVEQKVKKIEWKALSRWEVAVMTNILLDVYPQLTEKRELNEVSKACENYADEQDFTKDEKKAITRLCKLSIMWIHNDNNEPLEEFLVKQKASNWEFAIVMDRVVSSYNEKDLSTIKEALKKLGNDDEGVVFGTVYNVFMSIKNIFN